MVDQNLYSQMLDGQFSNVGGPMLDGSKFVFSMLDVGVVLSADVYGSHEPVAIAGEHSELEHYNVSQSASTEALHLDLYLPEGCVYDSMYYRQSRAKIYY